MTDPQDSRSLQKNRLTRLAVGALVSGAVAVAGLGPASGIAQADPQSPGPFQWCPGQPLPGNHFPGFHDPTRNITLPPSDSTVVWNNSVCHTYWRTPAGRGNVSMTDGSKSVWDGPDPPPYWEPVCAPFVPPVNCRPVNG
jgi:hypothetical protein